MIEPLFGILSDAFSAWDKGTVLMLKNYSGECSPGDVIEAGGVQMRIVGSDRMRGHIVPPLSGPELAILVNGNLSVQMRQLIGADVKLVPSDLVNLSDNIHANPMV